MAEVTPVKKPESRGIMNELREHTHIVLWILVFSFVGLIVFEWGMDLLGLRTHYSSDVIAKVGRTQIKYQDYWTRVQNQFEILRNQSEIAPDENTMRIVEEQVFQQIVNEILIYDEIQKIGLLATNEDVSIEIHYRPRPEFFNSPELKKSDGSFDAAKYESILRQLSKNDLLFLEADARARVPQFKLRDILLATVRVTEEEIKQAYLANEQNASVEYIVAEQTMFTDSAVAVTEQEIKNYYNAHKDDFFENETRQLRYVVFSTSPTPADSAEVKKKSEEAVKRAKADEDFILLSQEYTNSDGNLGTIAKGSMIPEIEKEVFSDKVKKGDIVGPITTSNGIHIIKIERVVKAKGKVDSVDAKQILFTYEPSTTTLQDAENKARYFSLAAQESGFDMAAEHEKVPIFETAPLQKSSFISGFGINFDIERFAFGGEIKKDQKPVSEPIQTPSGLTIFELSKINKERTKTLNDEGVKSQIESAIRTQKQLKMGQNLLAQVKSEIDAGASLEEAASKYNLTVQKAGPFKLNDPIPDVSYDLKFNSAALGLDPGNISNPVVGNNGVYLIHTITKDPFIQENYLAKRDGIAGSLLEQKQNAVYSQWIQKLRNETKITDYRSKLLNR